MGLASGFQATRRVAGVSKVSGAGVVVERPGALAVVGEDLHRLVPTDFAHLPDADAGVGDVVGGLTEASGLRTGDGYLSRAEPGLDNPGDFAVGQAARHESLAAARHLPEHGSVRDVGKVEPGL